MWLHSTRVASRATTAGQPVVCGLARARTDVPTRPLPPMGLTFTVHQPSMLLSFFFFFFFESSVPERTDAHRGTVAGGVEFVKGRS